MLTVLELDLELVESVAVPAPGRVHVHVDLIIHVLRVGVEVVGFGIVPPGSAVGRVVTAVVGAGPVGTVVAHSLVLLPPIRPPPGLPQCRCCHPRLMACSAREGQRISDEIRGARGRQI